MIDLMQEFVPTSGSSPTYNPTSGPTSRPTSGSNPISAPTSGRTSGPSPIFEPISRPSPTYAPASGPSVIYGRKFGPSPTYALVSGPSPISERASRSSPTFAPTFGPTSRLAYGPTTLTPLEAPSSSSSSLKKKWCVPKEDASETDLQANIDFVCKSSGIECGPINDGGQCFEPNTIRSHATYAMNAYYQASGGNDLDCDFGNTGRITYTDPSKFCYSTLDLDIHSVVFNCYVCVLLYSFVLLE